MEPQHLSRNPGTTNKLQAAQGRNKQGLCFSFLKLLSFPEKMQTGEWICFPERKEEAGVQQDAEKKICDEAGAVTLREFSRVFAVSVEYL